MTRIDTLDGLVLVEDWERLWCELSIATLLTVLAAHGCDLGYAIDGVCIHFDEEYQPPHVVNE